MSLLTKLFSRKTNRQQPGQVVQIGTEINRPTQISNLITDYLKEVPDWIGRHSGWGYGKEDALIMDTENSMDGIHNEYVFAEYRSKIVLSVSADLSAHEERSNPNFLFPGKLLISR